MTTRSDEARLRRKKVFFGLHVGGFVASALGLGVGLGEGSARAFVIAGLLLVASGIAAFAGGKSLLLPKTPIALDADPIEEARRREAMEQVSAWIVGFLFAAFGAAVTLLGLRAGA